MGLPMNRAFGYAPRNLDQGKLMSEQTTGRLYSVHIDGKSGYINAQGSVVVAAKFDMAGPFHDGLAQVGDLDLI